MLSKVCLFAVSNYSHLSRLLAPLPHPFSQIVFKAEVDWHQRHEFLKCMGLQLYSPIPQTDGPQSSCRSTFIVMLRHMKHPGVMSDARLTRIRRGTRQSSKCADIRYAAHFPLCRRSGG